MFTGWCFSLGIITVITLKYDAVLSSPLGIVNGTKAKLGEAPWNVETRDKDGNFHCGGSIIAPDWILTAAHCAFPEKAYGIIFGDLKLHTRKDGWPTNSNNSVLVKRVIQHPKYDVDALIFDIGLLQLEHKIPFHHHVHVHAVNLPKSDNVPFHVNGLFVGWGSATDEGFPNPDLQKLTRPLLTAEECKKRLDNGNKDDDKFIASLHVCMDSVHDGTCYGDSGAAYVIHGTQYGVNSYLLDDCASRPAVFARISNPEHLQWILKTIKS